jgi:hypothetical protein
MMDSAMRNFGLSAIQLGAESNNVKIIYLVLIIIIY